jgi:predicted alpha-1,6-mannanase (GH76 family)
VRSDPQILRQAVAMVALMIDMAGAGVSQARHILQEHTVEAWCDSTAGGPAWRCVAPSEASLNAALWRSIASALHFIAFL